jgi:CubicO group peptidase (beta-lactamase class C family)
MKLRFISIIVVFISTISFKVNAQQTYFPPINSSATWDTISPKTFLYCDSKINELYNFLEENQTKSFLLLKDGKIILEKYFDDHSASKLWYWASAGKSLTAFLVGLAEEDGYLSIDSPTTKYLGNGWTSCDSEEEQKITIKHQLSLTAGLDYTLGQLDCTADSCLFCLREPGTHWYYHNAPYTLLHQVLANVLPMTVNQYIIQKLHQKIGFGGSFLNVENNVVYFSNTRAMARFGLLIMNNGIWNGDTIMKNQQYFREMTNTSQNYNKAYGYLWWLNGKESFKVPQSDFVFNGSVMPKAPDDLIMALGKNGQFLNVSKKNGYVLVRMGDEPSTTLVPFILNDQIWDKVNQLPCENNMTKNEVQSYCKIYPNPGNNDLHIENNSNKPIILRFLDPYGRVVKQISLLANEKIWSDISDLSLGLYFIADNNNYLITKWIKN